MTKKALSLLCVGIVIALIYVIVSFSPLNGYYFSVEQLRKGENIYISSTIIHTLEMPDKYFDFIIDSDDNYCVIEINKKDTLFGQRYVKGTWSSKSMYDAVTEDINLYEQTGALDFTSFPHFGNIPEVKMSHCFAPSDYDIVQDDIQVTEFTYDGVQYLLCIKLEGE